VTSLDVRAAGGEDDYRLARELITEYLASLPFEVDFQDVEAELGDLPAHYGPPAGSVLIGFVDGSAGGVVALCRFDGPTCEMKRMFVRPEHRGSGLGRRLAEEVIGAARMLGYTQMLLDTVRELDAANALYESLGFRDVPSYRYNPRPDARYLALEL
jgi:putative acetyltransferase